MKGSNNEEETTVVDKDSSDITKEKIHESSSTQTKKVCSNSSSGSSSLRRGFLLQKNDKKHEQKIKQQQKQQPNQKQEQHQQQQKQQQQKQKQQKKVGSSFRRGFLVSSPPTSSKKKIPFPNENSTCKSDTTIATTLEENNNGNKLNNKSDDSNPTSTAATTTTTTTNVIGGEPSHSLSKTNDNNDGEKTKEQQQKQQQQEQKNHKQQEVGKRRQKRQGGGNFRRGFLLSSPSQSSHPISTKKDARNEKGNNDSSTNTIINQIQKLPEGYNNDGHTIITSKATTSKMKKESKPTKKASSFLLELESELEEELEKQQNKSSDVKLDKQQEQKYNSSQFIAPLVSSYSIIENKNNNPLVSPSFDTVSSTTPITNTNDNSKSNKIESTSLSFENLVIGNSDISNNEENKERQKQENLKMLNQSERDHSFLGLDADDDDDSFPIMKEVSTKRKKINTTIATNNNDYTDASLQQQQQQSKEDNYNLSTNTGVGMITSTPVQKGIILQTPSTVDAQLQPSNIDTATTRNDDNTATASITGTKTTKAITSVNKSDAASKTVQEKTTEFILLNKELANTLLRMNTAGSNANTEIERDNNNKYDSYSYYNDNDYYDEKNDDGNNSNSNKSCYWRKIASAFVSKLDDYQCSLVWECILPIVAAVVNNKSNKKNRDCNIRTHYRHYPCVSELRLGLILIEYKFHTLCQFLELSKSQEKEDNGKKKEEVVKETSKQFRIYMLGAINLLEVWLFEFQQQTENNIRILWMAKICKQLLPLLAQEVVNTAAITSSNDNNQPTILKQKCMILIYEVITTAAAECFEGTVITGHNDNDTDTHHYNYCYDNEKNENKNNEEYHKKTRADQDNLILTIWGFAFTLNQLFEVQLHWNKMKIIKEANENIEEKKDAISFVHCSGSFSAVETSKNGNHTNNDNTCTNSTSLISNWNASSNNNDEHSKDENKANDTLSSLSMSVSCNNGSSSSGNKQRYVCMDVVISDWQRLYKKCQGQLDHCHPIKSSDKGNASSGNISIDNEQQISQKIEIGKIWCNHILGINICMSTSSSNNNDYDDATQQQRGTQQRQKSEGDTKKQMIMVECGSIRQTLCHHSFSSMFSKQEQEQSSWLFESKQLILCLKHIQSLTSALQRNKKLRPHSEQERAQEIQREEKVFVFEETNVTQTKTKASNLLDTVKEGKEGDNNEEKKVVVILRGILAWLGQSKKRLRMIVRKQEQLFKKRRKERIRQQQQRQKYWKEEDPPKGIQRVSSPSPQSVVSNESSNSVIGMIIAVCSSIFNCYDSTKQEAAGFAMEILNILLWSIVSFADLAQPAFAVPSKESQNEDHDNTGVETGEKRIVYYSDTISNTKYDNCAGSGDSETSTAPESFSQLIDTILELKRNINSDENNIDN